ncbi:MAG: NACHT domain-containing protein, partial [Cyanobacteria bacterium J06621_8]
MRLSNEGLLIAIKAYAKLQKHYNLNSDDKNKYSHAILAESVGTSRSTISRFFGGENIQAPTFMSICSELNIEHSDVIEFYSIKDKKNNSDEKQSSTIIKIQERRQKRNDRHDQEDYKLAQSSGKILNSEQVECLEILINNKYNDLDLRRELLIFHENIIKRALNREKISPKTYRRIDNYFFNNASLFKKVSTIRNNILKTFNSETKFIRILGMETPISFDDIYIKTKVLKRLSKNQYFDINELVENNFQSDTNILDKGIINKSKNEDIDEIISKHNKIIIYGKPGAGKTTLLKKITLDCLENKKFAFKLPIYLEIRDCVDSDNNYKIEEYINLYLNNYNISLSNNEINELIRKGVIILLFDGLDEINDDNQRQFIDYISKRFNKDFKECFTIISSRLISRKYPINYFKELEISDFSEDQILLFTRKWFKNNLKFSDNLLKQINENSRLYELSTNPLLITLICIVYENRNQKLPNTRAELYEEGINILVEKWDLERRIKRNCNIDSPNSIQQKAILEKLAYDFFTVNKIFFSKDEYENKINYIINNTLNKNSIEYYELDLQHGIIVERANNIFSFSHLLFKN